MHNRPVQQFGQMGILPLVRSSQLPMDQDQPVNQIASEKGNKYEGEKLKEDERYKYTRKAPFI